MSERFCRYVSHPQLEMPSTTPLGYAMRAGHFLIYFHCVFSFLILSTTIKINNKQNKTTIR
jgi:hypothetical protein